MIYNNLRQAIKIFCESVGTLIANKFSPDDPRFQQWLDEEKLFLSTREDGETEENKLRCDYLDTLKKQKTAK